MWVQCYDPLGNWPASTLAAALPVFVLLGLLAWGRVHAAGAAMAGLSAACIMAFFVFGMPAEMILASAVVGLVFAAFRVVWLVVAAVFLYDIAVTTGQFEVMKASVASLSGDRRLQAVLVAFSFGAFIEGQPDYCCRHLGGLSGGSGVPALSGSLALLDRQHGPGGLGGNRTSAPDLEDGHRAGCRGPQRHLRTDSPSAFGLIPFWLVRTMTGWRNALGVWLPLAVIGGTFAAVQFLWSNLVDFELVGIVAAVHSMTAGVIVMRFWKPSSIWRFDHEAEVTPVAVDVPPPPPPSSGSQVQLALAPGRVAHRLDAVRVVDAHGARVGSSGHQVVGNSRGQRLAGCTSLLEAGSSLAAFEGCQGSGGHRT